jgi:ABC-type antimicrobial peptide transport system permease subunit
LLIACFNLTNTTIAISARRLKEIGIRKVMGSARIQLVIQFIGETTFICLLALIAGLGIADFLVAGWNLMTSNFIHLETDYLGSPGFFLFLCAVLLLTGILAGSYPAFYISKFTPVTVLKGKLKFGGTNYFTRILLGLQFSISLISIVSAIGFLQNAQYQKDYDLGFDVRGAIVARVNDRGEFEIYRNALNDNPLVLSIAGAQSGIFSNPTHEPVKHDSRQVEVDIIEVGDNYLNTMDLKLKEGRDFIKDSETDLRESVIITEKMANLFNWQDPIGKEIIWKDSVKLYVVGVIGDVYTRGLWQEMEPMMIRYVHPDRYNQIVVSTKAEHVSEVNAYMDEQWSKVFPDRLYNGFRMDNILQQVSVLNTSIMYGYVFLGAIALLLSVTGLYTLVSLSIIRRMKEIGIRKIVGASVANITRVVNTEFVVILAIASVMGSWAGFNWCNTIMSTIWKYHQGVNVLTFITAVGLLFTVSFLAIGYKIFSIATMNPVKTLRDE